MTQDANINKAKSEASSAAIDVAEKNIKFKYIEPKLLLDLKKENIDIAKITQDMNLTKQNIILKELEIKLARESHPLKIKELRAKIGKATEEINQSTREKADNYKNTIDTFNNTINTVDKILANPELEKVTGIVEGRLPGFSGLQTDAIADIETLQSQLFLSQVKELKGMGALSDAEGKKLDASISSLDRKQTYEQFKQNLNYIRNTITKGIQKASDKYQMKPRIDRPYLKSDPKKVDEILKKYGVK
jgi:phage-related protein